MDRTLNRKLFLKYQEKNLAFRNVCEVGVYFPETSNVLDFIEKGIRTVLVEPDPDSIGRIREAFRDKKNVTLFPVAIYDYHGAVELVRRNASTFVGELPFSPATINDHYTLSNSDTFTVECVVFSEIDTNDFDLLSIDVEGCEWYVLKHMRSRPVVISLETHGKLYTNPFMKEISQWMKENNYKVWYKTMSDSVYCRNDSIEQNVWEKVQLLGMELRIRFRRLKRFLGGS